MKKIFEAILTFFVLVIIAIPTIAVNVKIENGTIDSDQCEYVSGEIIVKFKDGLENNEVSKINSRCELSVISSSKFAGFQRLKIPQEKTVFEIIDILKQNPNVEYVEPNFIAHANLIPNDPYYNYQWHLHDLSQGGINMEPAWGITTGSGAVVAIIDTGIRVGSDLSNTCFVPGYDFVNNDNNPIDDNGHGTHVAGTVSQSTNNNNGVAGVAFGACLMPVKVLNAQGSGTYAAIVDGIYFAVNNGAKIISMSLGGSSGSQALLDALAYAYNNGVTCIAASGNNGQNGVLYPAAYNAYVIAVGATQYDKTRAPYSNYGSSLDVMAPGGNTNVDQNGDGYGDGVLQQTFKLSGSTVQWGYYFYQGTSMATPHVSGVAALLYSNGVTTPDGIRNTLQSTAIDLGATGWDIYYGYGLINAYNALLYNPGNSPPTCTLTANPNSGIVPFTTTFSMIASDSDGTITSWKLDVNNDGTADYSGNGNPPASQVHTYNNQGTFAAKLTVWDDDNAIGSDTEIITVTSSEIIEFSDSFENGQWNGKWVEDSQNDWFTSTQRKTDGSYSAEVDGRAIDATLTMLNAIDLSGITSATLTYSWFIESNWDSGEYIALDMYNGISWTEVKRLRGNVDTENIWHHETIDLSDYLVNGFKIRFRAKVSDSTEDGNIDNVKIIHQS